MSSSKKKHILIICDSFKDCFDSKTANLCIKNGIKLSKYPSIITAIPFGDGGEGTIEALTYHRSHKEINVFSFDPLMRKITSKYKVINDRTALIELSSASGLMLLNNAERNPCLTSTYGTGLLIKDALKRGYRDFIITLGGSATNDGGVGLLSALGFEFLDKDNKRINYGGLALEKLSKIKTNNHLKELDDSNFIIATDVDAVLCGSYGASKIFAKQKGATLEMIDHLDLALSNFSNLTKKLTKKDYQNFPGSGAAGGTAYGLLSYLNAKLVNGADFVIKKLGIENKIKNADIVITGEGKLDSQSLMGKAVFKIVNLAKKYNKLTFAFVGYSNLSNYRNYNLDYLFTLNDKSVLKINKKTEKKHLIDKTYEVFSNFIK